MKKNRNMIVFSRNHSSGHQPVLSTPLSMDDRGNGARHPPRNMVVASAETVTMLTYSERKNSANFSEEYSVWKPPTSSLSASARSKGARLVSPTIDTTYTAKLPSSTTMNQRSACAATMAVVDKEPV